MLGRPLLLLLLGRLMGEVGLAYRRVRVETRT